MQEPLLLTLIVLVAVLALVFVFKKYLIIKKKDSGSRHRCADSINCVQQNF